MPPRPNIRALMAKTAMIAPRVNDGIAMSVAAMTVEIESEAVTVIESETGVESGEEVEKTQTGMFP